MGWYINRNVRPPPVGRSRVPPPLSGGWTFCRSLGGPGTVFSNQTVVVVTWPDVLWLDTFHQDKQFDQPNGMFILPVYMFWFDFARLRNTLWKELACDAIPSRPLLLNTSLKQTVSWVISNQKQNTGRPFLLLTGVFRWSWKGSMWK